MYDLHGTNSKFEIGKAFTLREGSDVVFFATGETVIHCLLAASHLESEGLGCAVVSVPTIKPLDSSAILKMACGAKAVVTAEEHSIHGGLGEACAALLIQAGANMPMRIVGIPDEDTVTGSQADIFRHYGISMEGLSAVALELVRHKQVMA